MAIVYDRDYGSEPNDSIRKMIYVGLFLLASDLIDVSVGCIIKWAEEFYRDTTFGEEFPFHSYEKDVVQPATAAGLDDDRFESILLYLKDKTEAVGEDDIRAIIEVRKRRVDYIKESEPEETRLEEDDQLLESARSALFRLDHFLINMNLGSDPDYLSQSIDFEKARGAQVVILDELIKATKTSRLSR